MANPKHYYGNAGYPNFPAIPDESVYADITGHVLEFHDARSADPLIGGTGVPGEIESSFVTFIAFLTGFSQSFTSNWSTTEVYGRMDPISTFKNTTRTISVAWDIPAGKWEVAKDNLDRCNHLINLAYPSYSPQAGSDGNALAMSKPPLVRMRYANLVVSNEEDKGLLGFLASVNWNPVIDMGYYHVGEKIYPKVIQLAVEFKVLHEVNLGFNNEGKPYHGGSTTNTSIVNPGGGGPDVNWPFKK